MVGDGLLLEPPGTWIGDLLVATTAVFLASYMTAARVWNITHRDGSDCLNRFRAIAKWISVWVKPLPGLAAAR